MTFSLLSLCARTHPDPAAIRAAIPADFDANVFAALADRHKVVPLVARALTQVFVTDPREFERMYAPFKPLHTVAVARSLACVQALISVGAAFEAAGIAFIPFKGVMLAKLYYGDPALRQFLDLDVLVHPKDMKRARAALISNGWQLDDFPAQIDHPAEYHAHLQHPAFGVSLELHWALAFRRFAAQSNANLFWDTAKPVTFYSRSVLAPSDEAMLIYLCAHGYRHGWSRLSWVCDVAEVICARPQLDWELVDQLAGSQGMRSVVLLGLALAHRLLDAPIPTAFKAKIIDNKRVSNALNTIIEWLSAPTPASDMALQAFHLSLADSWRDQAAYLPYALRHFAATKLRPNARDRAFVKLPPALDFLYYLVRPVRLIIKVVWGNHHSQT